METRDGRLVRLRTEERIDEVRYRLAVDEATGGKAGGDCGPWEVEEELLDELAELERVVSGNTAAEGPRTTTEGRARWA